MDCALAAIRLAREVGISFLGTCGGFQHARVDR
jgi:CTP synthase (UTP-ammonia lyase)